MPVSCISLTMNGTRRWLSYSVIFFVDQVVQTADRHRVVLVLI